jgi:hypothetical protein
MQSALQSIANSVNHQVAALNTINNANNPTSNNNSKKNAKNSKPSSSQQQPPQQQLYGAEDTIGKKMNRLMDL